MKCRRKVTFRVRNYGMTRYCLMDNRKFNRRCERFLMIIDGDLNEDLYISAIYETFPRSEG